MVILLNISRVIKIKMLFPWLTLFDFKGALSNFIKDKKVDLRQRCDDFAILVPIFNDIRHLKNIEFLSRYKEKVALCTTNVESQEFYHALYQVSGKHGFKIIKTNFKKDVKNPWKIYQKTLLAHDYVLGEAIKILNAQYIVFLDADTTSQTDLSCLAGIMEKENIDLASVRVIPSRRKTSMEHLQYIEYYSAMKSRKIYPWLTSGASMIGKRESLKKIMSKHSLFFNGGDIEIGKLAYLMGMKVEHIPITFYTDVPERFSYLIKQRSSWFCGAFRHSVINAHTNLFNPLYSLYFTMIIFLMLPFKWHELFFHWYTLPFLFLFYTGFTIASNWKIRNKYMLLFPIYSFIQVLLFPLLGIYRYTMTVIKTRNPGFMRIFYKEGYPYLKYFFNVFLIGNISFMIFNMNIIENYLSSLFELLINRKVQIASLIRLTMEEAIKIRGGILASFLIP